ncbi:MAG TPA: D-alanyl-D-alanine carboxypeptidase [Firmicutes bacterium]|nr:D-alanyl-D-alanine carboxypeptidase [Bacillota bacterium]
MRKFKGLIITFLVLCLFSQANISAKAISSECGILVEQVTGRVLFEKCADQQKYIASITKIMTAIIAVEEGDLDGWVEISENATLQVGSSLYLKQGDKVKLIDLIYGLMLRSGNDSAMAIAEEIGGSEEEFVKMMNEKAKELGMTNSVFQNPSGLDETTYNLSTAADMAKVMRYAMNHPVFREVVGTKVHKTQSEGGVPYVWQNKHKLVTGYYEYAIGGKTGFTKQARRTLVTSAQKDGLELVVVTLTAGDDWNDHMSLFNMGFDNYELKTVIPAGFLNVDPTVSDSKLFIKQDAIVAVKKDGSETVSTELKLSQDNTTDNEVGTLIVKINDEVMDEIPVYQQVELKDDQPRGWFQWLFGWLMGDGDTQ